MDGMKGHIYKSAVGTYVFLKKWLIKGATPIHPTFHVQTSHMGTSGSLLCLKIIIGCKHLPSAMLPKQQWTTYSQAEWTFFMLY